MAQAPATEVSLQRIRKYVAKYREKSGTTEHPEKGRSAKQLIQGLAAHPGRRLGKPLCPCNFLSGQEQGRLAENGRRWVLRLRRR